MEAAPDAQQAQAGAAGAEAGAAGAEAGAAQRGPPQPGAGGEAPAPPAKPLDANPLRGLGSALERWRARLAVRSDAPEVLPVSFPTCRAALCFLLPGALRGLGSALGHRCARLAACADTAVVPDACLPHAHESRAGRKCAMAATR